MNASQTLPLGHLDYEQTLVLLQSWLGRDVVVSCFVSEVEVRRRGILLRAGVSHVGTPAEAVLFFVSGHDGPAFVLELALFDVGHHFTWEGRPALIIKHDRDHTLVIA